jgi:DNA-binding CsgD family transcriptional regulator
MVVDKKYFVFGTIQSGILISDTAGKIITHINKSKGLQNNTVLSVGSDNENNVWLGLDNGISYIHFSSPLTYMQNYVDIGSGYVSARFGDNLYLGTNQGLFCIAWSDFTNPLKKKENFHLVEGTEGQVWSLAVIRNVLLCGHNSGVFEVHGQVAYKISSVAGGWTIRQAGTNGQYLFVGNYSGISVFEKNGQSWKYRNKLNGFDQSSHFLETDDKGYLWIGHGYKGVFRVKPDADMRRVLEVRFYNSMKGLPSDLGTTLFKIKSGIVAGTLSGVYRYNENRDQFEPDKLFNKLIPLNGQVDYVFQDDANNIWYNYNQQPSVLRYQEDGTYKNISVPFSDLTGMLLPPYGHINPLDAQNVLFGIEGGFAHYNSGQNKDYGLVPTLYINNIYSADTSEGVFKFNSGNGEQNIVPAFRFRNNTISFSFASNQFSKPETNYQFFLQGFDKDWSEWSQKNSKEYTNLPYGEYTFQLKAMKEDGTPSPVLSYSFKISPPWYFSTIAWIIYFITIIYSVFLMYRFFNRSIEKSRMKEKEQQRSKYKQREEQFKEDAHEAEKEMIRLRNEKLNLEMIHKEKELANSTMMLIHKNEMLHKLVHDLNRVKSTLTDEQHKSQMNSAINKISREIDNEKQWQVFNTHIEQVHEQLFIKLKEKYPDLSPRELSLCAYLRMNISSKEIATLMNISTRGVEIGRYRIRKKLGLDRTANLTDYMMNL